MNIPELKDYRRYQDANEAMEFRPKTKVYFLSVNKETNVMQIEYTSQNDKYPKPFIEVRRGL